MKKVFKLIILLLVAGCAGNPVLEITEKGNKASDIRVLFAVESSDFKDELLEKVVAGLDSDVYIKITDIGNLPEEKTEDYNAVVIFTVKRVFSINRKASDFIKNTSEPDKIIIYFTEAGSSRIPKSLEDVDAVSSASQKENISDIAENIVNKIKQRF
jgi:hypothetical protein